MRHHNSNREGVQIDRILVALCMAFVLSASLVGRPAAQTPDGGTPAMENICEGQIGAAFGLCNAYCEAMDCDGSPEASQAACDRVKATYLKFTGMELFPCEIVAVGDIDQDGVPDDLDNCPAIVNPNQVDSDFDLSGDVCDNCPEVPNENQSDVDGDSVGDACDNCLVNPNPDQSDLDFDAIGDACEPDTDGDGVPEDYALEKCSGGNSTNCNDNCSLISNPLQEDSDGNGTGDACEGDSDQDGFKDEVDNCPFRRNFDQADFDGDGAGDACDPDADGDSIFEALFGEYCTGGNTTNCDDNCDFVPNPDQADADGDGIGDACDPN